MLTSGAVRLLRFGVDQQSYALALRTVERVIRAVALTPLPGAPTVIRGVFSLHGQIIPVADPRLRLGFQADDIELDDRIIVARIPNRLLGVLVHGDVEVLDCPQRDIVDGEAVLSGLEQVQGIGRLPDGLVLIHDLAKFLTIEETRSLERALGATGEGEDGAGLRPVAVRPASPRPDFAP